MENVGHFAMYECYTLRQIYWNGTVFHTKHWALETSSLRSEVHIPKMGLYTQNAQLIFLNKAYFMSLHVILAQGHANLLCIIPTLIYALPKWALTNM